MSDVRYQNFDLTIQRDGEEYRSKVESPAGQGTGRFSVPFSDLEIENFILTTTPGRRSVRRIDTPEVAAAKRFGERLFNSIFTGEALGRLHSALNDAYHSDDRLRIRLRLTEVPELADLPWEYLYNPSLNRFLALDDDTALVRYLELPERVRPVTVALPLRVLVAISNPNDYPRLDVEQEWANLNEALGGLEREGLLDLNLLEDATFPALRRQLSKGQYHIFHFIGHGGFDRQTEEGVLVLKDEHGRGRLVSGQQLGWLMRNHRTLALAVLNACEGARADRTDVFAGTAQSLVQQGIPAVVAMQREITDDAAKTFAHAFYSAVADGRPVEAAMTETRLAIFAEGFGLEWATPVLYMRAPDGRVFDLQAPVTRAVESKKEAPAPVPVPVPVPVVVEPEPEKVVVAPVEVEATGAGNEAVVGSGDVGDNIANAATKSADEMLRTITQDVTQKTGEVVSERMGRAQSRTKQREGQARRARFGWARPGLVLVGIMAGILLLAWLVPSALSPNGNSAGPTATAQAAALAGRTPSAFALSKTLELPASLSESAYADALVFSEDSKYLAGWFYTGDGSTATNTGQLDIWHVEDNPNDPIQDEWMVEGYDRLYPQLTFFPSNFANPFTSDTELAAALVKDSEVAVRRIEQEDNAPSISITDAISVDVTSDGKVLVGGSRGGRAGLWDPETGELLHELVGHSGDVESAAFSPSGDVVVTTEFGQTRIWDGHSGAFQYAIIHSLANVPGTTKTEFAHDGLTVAVCSSQADCGFWRVSDGAYIGSLESEVDRSNLGKMLAVGFTADDQVLATGWEDGVVQFWKDGGLYDTIRADLGGKKVSAMAFSSDLRYLALGLVGGPIQIWQMP